MYSFGGVFWEPACIPPTCAPGMEGRTCSRGASASTGICCGGSCVDPTTDPANCLRCGAACATGYCQANFGCLENPVPANCGQTCAPGTICAGNDCVDSTCPVVATVLSYPTPTPLRRYCLAEDGSAGVCCPSGGCAHLDSDNQNCGGCGVVCPEGSTCQSGLCGGKTACGPGQAGAYCNLDGGVSFLCCPGTGCVDTSWDSQNCGACGAPCDGGCDAGVCATQ